MSVTNFYNTLTRRKEELRPIRPPEVSIYVCGITVYDYCHLGHARVLTVFDAIVRWLKARGYKTNYARNITDIDDKIIARAAQNGEPYEQLTERFITAMREDEQALSLLPPDIEPRATAHIDDIFALIERLLASGHAYRVEGDVYYSVESFSPYGKLSRRDPQQQLAGARVEVDERKRAPADFALWKSSPQGEPSWAAPWGGNGRPGWHIECSAMSMCCLGESFDVHGGGPDLVFPHHENEIAQSEAVTGKPYAQLWLHAGPVRVGAEKMSKSLGNFLTLRDLRKAHRPESLRYFLLASHYRSAIDYDDQALRAADASLERLYAALRDAPAAFAVDADASLAASAESRALGVDVTPWVARFAEALDDDFNTPKALAELFSLARAVRDAAPERAAKLAACLRQLGGALGLLQQVPEAFLQASPADDGRSAEAIEALIAEREAARARKDFSAADAIRARLEAEGIELEDSRDGVRWRRRIAD